MRTGRDAEAGGTSYRAANAGAGRNPGSGVLGASTRSSDKDNPVAQGQELIERMIEGHNLDLAWQNVRKNQGSPGIDGRDMDATMTYIRKHRPEIEAHLKAGTYVPKPVKRVEINKPSGGVRKLAVPCILDHWLQQAALQVLTPLFDPDFSEHSYGFRPGRSAHQAVEQARHYQTQGKGWVVDLDLASFFDEVDHDLLMARVRRKVSDKAMLKLIRAFLSAGVTIRGLTQATDKGTPQGGPLSPLLSNIMLDDLDKELQRRGHTFCRYADHCNIYVGTKRSGQRVLESLTAYLQRKLKLKVNRDKSAVDRPSRRTFLGYSFTPGKKPRIRVPKPTTQKMKNKLKQLCRQGRGRNLERFINEQLNPLLRGWSSYFRLSETKTFALELDQWLRHRLRSILWRQWKRPRTRQAKLVALGLNKERAHKSSVNGRGAWWNSGASHMNAAIPRKTFEQMGLLCIYDQIMSLRKASN